MSSISQVKTKIRKAGKAYKLDLWVKARHAEDELMEVQVGEQHGDEKMDFSRPETP